MGRHLRRVLDEVLLLRLRRADPAARRHQADLPLPILDAGLAQECWAFWDKNSGKWSWHSPARAAARAAPVGYTRRMPAGCDAF